MTNCKNCGAPIDIYTGRCSYCETPYEAPGGSETGENFGRKRMQDKRKDKLKADLIYLEDTIGSKWTDEDFMERAIKHARGESLAPKWL